MQLLQWTLYKNVPMDDASIINQAYWKQQADLKDDIIHELVLSLKRYRDENASLKEMVASLQLEKDNLLGEIESLKSKINTQNSPATKIVEENASLKERVASLQLEKDNLLREIESLKSKIKNQTSPVVVDTPTVTKKQNFPESQASGSSTPVKNIKPLGNVEIESFSIPTFSLNISADEEPEKAAGLNIPPEYMLTNEEMAKIQALHATTGGDDNIYWDNLKTTLHRSDIEPLFKSDFSSDKLMDAWSFFMALDQADTIDKTGVPRSYAFQGNLWSYMMSFPSGAQKAVENELTIIRNTGVRYALFPMTTPGVGTSELHQFSTSIHWTLFVYDTIDCIWSFYNSMLPRNKKAKDLYFEEALHLANFVHRIIQHSPMKKSKELTTERVLDCAQQQTGSVDCGFVVMMQIESFVKGVETKKGIVSCTEVIQFKSRFLKRLINSPHFVDHKEMEYLRNLQKEYEASETISDVVRAIEKEQIDLSTPSDFK